MSIVGEEVKNFCCDPLTVTSGSSVTAISSHTAAVSVVSGVELRENPVG